MVVQHFTEFLFNVKCVVKLLCSQYLNVLDKERQMGERKRDRQSTV